MRSSLVIAALTALGAALPAQSLASRVTQSDGTVQVIYSSRPGVCGDGVTFIANVVGGDTYFTSGSVYTGRSNWTGSPCIHGPVRVVAAVMDGEVTRLRPYVGPLAAGDARTINASVAEARTWLEGLVMSGGGRTAQEAVLPMVLADSTNPWPVLLRVVRDEQRPLGLRRSMLTWLARGVNEHLGIEDATPQTDDDEMRKQAVFVLSQRAKREGSTELMEVARTSKRPAVRRDAIFWLSQTGDVRAVADLYADLLK